MKTDQNVKNLKIPNCKANSQKLFETDLENIKSGDKTYNTVHLKAISK